jgi:HK97 family phage major capsid protein
MKKLLLGTAMVSIANNRAIAGRVRADVTDPKALVAAIQASFQEFRDANDERMTKVEAKVDPLDLEKLEKMATNVLELQAAMDVQAKQIAANRIGGGETQAFNDPEYSAKFAGYFRDGANESDIKAAQKVGIRASLTEGSAANGGYTTPIEWDRTITDKLKMISPIRQEATVQPISSIGFSKVYNDRSIGSGWVGEVAARSFGQWVKSTPMLLRRRICWMTL